MWICGSWGLRQSKAQVGVSLLRGGGVVDSTVENGARMPENSWTSERCAKVVSFPHTFRPHLWKAPGALRLSSVSTASTSLRNCGSLPMSSSTLRMEWITVE